MNRKDMARMISETTIENLVDMIFIDPVSGIPNRKAFEFARPKFVAIIDLDSLKWINDNLGHTVGDNQLRMLGSALSSVFGDNAFHLSGDEFAVVGDILPDIHHKLKALQRTMNIFSFGVSVNLTRADKSMQMDKRDRQTMGLRSERGEAPAFQTEL